MLKEAKTRHETDAIIIGAGPVGLFAIFQLGMLKLACHVVDALPVPGGQLSALYPEKPIYDIPGFTSILAGELVDRLLAQAKPFHPQFHQDCTVTSLSRLPDGRWEVDLSDGQVLIAPVVIIAAGPGAFGPHRPPLDGLADYENKSVFYMVRRSADFAGKRVVIAGGGDSAVDWAICLADIAARVMVIHRRAKFRAAPASAARLLALAEAGAVDLVVPCQLHGLEGAAGILSAVVVSDLEGHQRKLPADVLLAFFGLASQLGPIAQWGLEMDGHQIAVDAARLATNLPGVFAIGDIASYPGKLKLILQGFSEAAMAAQAAHCVVRPDRAIHFEHSTTLGVPVV
ncbi:MAG TPA: NAD(P)/FAD-dependent oxidoreductase [Rhodospirillaceae bacterium]|nr:NAD(P)/FAD-dependent oxidoreductase [Rhodospirillaceae bacterium]